MIFLRGHNLLFLKPRKVAGTSFEIALSQFADKKDIITPISPNDEKIRTDRGFLGPQNHWKAPTQFDATDTYQLVCNRKYPIQFFNHISAKKAREKLGADVFDGAYKVSIVRNPYDVLVSQYFFKMKSKENRIEFIDWIRRNPSFVGMNNQQYFIDGVNIVDYFVRFERLLEDTSELENLRPELRGLSEVLGSIQAKAGIRPKGATAASNFAGSSELISAVRFFNADMMNRFGYDVE